MSQLLTVYALDRQRTTLPCPTELYPSCMFAFVVRTAIKPNSGDFLGDSQPSAIILAVYRVFANPHTAQMTYT